MEHFGKKKEYNKEEEEEDNDDEEDEEDDEENEENEDNVEDRIYEDVYGKTVESEDVNDISSLKITSFEKMSDNVYRIFYTNQDHTFGNLISERLNNDKDVIVAIYKTVPHSKNQSYVEIRVKKDTDVKKIIINAAKLIIKDFENIKRAFQS